MANNLIENLNFTKNNSKGISGECSFNNHQITFDFFFHPNGAFKTHYIGFPTNSDWDKIIPSQKGRTGHKYYVALAIEKHIRNNNLAV
jgi:hypothetical protein